MSSHGNEADLLTAALRYAALGYRVFPCVPDTKRPAIKHGFLDATTDAAQIRQWWSEHPHANIGIATSDLVVVDPDRDIDGPPNPWPARPKERDDLTTAPTSLTPRGGSHHIFRQPAGKDWRNTESQLAPKVDTRGNGGYIVVAPSVVNGRPYKWISPLPPVHELHHPPDWLTEKLDALAKGKKPSATSNGKPRGGLPKYVQTALDAELGRVAMASEGIRNSTLNKAAFALGQFVGAGALDHAVAKTKLADAAARCGLPEREALATIHSGLDAGAAQPRKVPDGKKQAKPEDAQQVERHDETVIIVSPAEHVVNAAAVRAIAKDPALFQRGGQLVRIVRDPATSQIDGIVRQGGAPRILALSKAVVRDRLAANTLFLKTGRGGDLIPAHPPGWCVAAVTEYGQWPLRVLKGIVDCPVLRSDGTILATPGYDPQTGLFLEPGGPTVRVSDQPIRDEVDDACELLFDVVVDFPFASDAHRAAWLAALLTPLARQAFDGPAPLFAIDSNIRGAGKGLSVEVLSQIVSGRPMPIMAAPRDDEESRKRITALAVAGDPLVLLDNIAGTLGSPALDAALTATTWKDRLLGRTELVEMPLNATWYCTGNNIAFRADTARRVCHIRLESKEENPEERQGFKHPALKTYVVEHRGPLLSAALTILRGWFANGRPDMKLTPWGSFEGWSAIVRNTLVWAGLPDPGTTRTELRATADTEAQALTAIIEGVAFLGGDEGIAVSSLLERCRPNLPDGSPGPVVALREALLSICPTRGAELPSPNSVGMKFHHLKGRVVGGRCLQDRSGAHKVKFWKVVDARGD